MLSSMKGRTAASNARSIASRSWWLHYKSQILGRRICICLILFATSRITLDLPFCVCLMSWNSVQSWSSLIKEIQHCLSSVRKGMTSRSCVAGFFQNEEWSILASPSRFQTSQTITISDSVSSFPISCWSIASSTQFSNTAACLYLSIPLWFSGCGIWNLLSPITEVPVVATDCDLLNELGGLLDPNLLLLLLPAI